MFNLQGEAATFTLQADTTYCLFAAYVLYYMKLSTLGGLDYWIELVSRNMYLFKLNVRSIEFVVPVPASCFHYLFFYCFQVDA